MPRGNDPTRAKIRPDPRARLLIWILRQQARTMVGESFFEEFADDGALVERFIIVFESRDEAAGVKG